MSYRLIVFYLSISDTFLVGSSHCTTEGNLLAAWTIFNTSRTTNQTKIQCTISTNFQDMTPKTWFYWRTTIKFFIHFVHLNWDSNNALSVISISVTSPAFPFIQEGNDDIYSLSTIRTLKLLHVFISLPRIQNGKYSFYLL